MGTNMLRAKHKCLKRKDKLRRNLIIATLLLFNRRLISQISIVHKMQYDETMILCSNESDI
jgi:hypothetical protein